MEGFKSNTKMQHFKEGGQVKYETRKEHKEEVSADVAQDKKIVKKAFKMHDEQEHKGERTDLSKLKKGGRSKKATGTVKKYKTGGTVENQYAAKKTDKDIKDIANTKRQKPQLLCGGKSVKKMADGGGLPGQGAISDAERAALLGALPGGKGQGSISDIERMRMAARAKNAMKYLGPAQQSEFVNQGGMSPTGVTGQKRGGKVKKYAVGGGVLPDQAPTVRGLERAAAMSGRTMPAPLGGTLPDQATANAPDQSNAGGAMRGLDRAAAMSGRTMPVIGGRMKKGGKACK